MLFRSKRYTSIVKPDDVRSLLGAVQDEGAMKGILVTTSDYGPGCYKTVKNNPIITLINGQELLYMLKKHGYEARIDLDEAKLEIKESKKT